MVNNGKSCSEDVNYSDKCKNTASWVTNKFCQQSCYDNGAGYDGDDCSSGWSDDECREKCSDASDCHSDCGSKCGAGCNCNGGCTDKPPPSGWRKNTCDLQKAAGNCEKSWFRNHAEGYCHQTCGKCASDAIVDAVECPDGSIGWQGVLMTAGYSQLSGRDNICAAWDSQAARLGMQFCTLDRKTCTKLSARHLHKMSKSVGVLMMKRIKCDDEGCAVFKAGKCFDVGQDVFSNINNDRMMDKMGDETQEWASLAVAQLKAGTATACGNTTGVMNEDDLDHKIATAGILGY
jgi:hypothetical protein